MKTQVPTTCIGTFWQREHAVTIIDSSMIAFIEWIAHRDVATLLRLLERADYFAPDQYNLAFVQGLNDLQARIHDAAAREQIEALRDFDFANYISRSLQRAGFRGDDLQEHFHNLVVRLLVKPGKLFSGWNPKQHGPLERRFFRSVRNGIINIAEKARNRRKWMTATDPVTMAGMFAGHSSHSSSLIDQFQQLVGQRLGKLAAAILDLRLSGGDMKELVGRADLGGPSMYSIKREVRAIKEMAQRFAAESDDPAFIAKMQHAMDAEAETVAKRQRSVTARQAGR
jgi:hypothetical protein